MWIPNNDVTTKTQVESGRFLAVTTLHQIQSASSLTCFYPPISPCLVLLTFQLISESLEKNIKYEITFKNQYFFVYNGIQPTGHKLIVIFICCCNCNEVLLWLVFKHCKNKFSFNNFKNSIFSWFVAQQVAE